MSTVVEDAQGDGALLRRRFEACVADWDGTLVPDRTSDAGRVRTLVEDLSSAGFDIIVITGTHVDNVDGQLRARPRGPGRLLFCVNRGSEVFECGAGGPTLLERRIATEEEDHQLDRAAALTVERLRERGVEATIVAQRLNRRKVDIIPLPEWADPPKARIGELLAAVEARLARAGIASVADVVAIAQDAAREAGMADARISSDAKYVEIGLTDKADAARWAFAELWAHGIAPGDVLVAGDEFGVLGGVPGSDSLMLVPSARGATAVTVGAEPFGAPPGVLAVPGGPDRMLQLFDEQLETRTRGEPPHPQPPAGWRVAVEGVDADREQARSSVFTVADGCIGTTGALLLSHPSSTPSTLVAGFYDGEGPEERLLPCPAWNQVEVPLAAGARVSRVLDLHAGVLAQSVEQDGAAVSAALFSSLAQPGTSVLWAAGDTAMLGPAGEDGEAAVSASHGGALRIERREQRRGHENRTALERVTVYAPGVLAPGRRAAAGSSANQLHRDHREAWARRWMDADIVIDGDEELQSNLRFSLFQLMSSVGIGDEAALGARGLSGDGYRGHVFWDSDVFALPFLAASCAPAARAMMSYRVHRLGTAAERARRHGLAGARFPWESASTGEEITPATVLGPRGEVVTVRTGEMEDHITADVAWAACRYADWSGDEEFARGPLQRLLVETARYWASRIERDPDGSAHIRHVIGPDEYHDDVDDNAFTNVLVRWNLRAAIARAGSACDDGELRTWAAIADSLVDGLDAATGVYEQFTGFSRLTPFPLRERYGPDPFAADSVIGFDRIQSLQVLKQADVLMLHLLVPDEVAPGSLAANLGRYLPITAHGSSLSPAVHAALLARAGRDDEALALLKLAARIDVDDVSGTTAHGLHIATMGGVWLAMVEGFAGIRADGDGLVVRPHLPRAWQGLTVNLRFRGVHVTVRIEPGATHVQTDRPLRVTVAGAGS